jgi:hypothetical protein
MAGKAKIIVPVVATGLVVVVVSVITPIERS